MLRSSCYFPFETTSYELWLYRGLFLMRWKGLLCNSFCLLKEEKKSTNPLVVEISMYVVGTKEIINPEDETWWILESWWPGSNGWRREFSYFRFEWYSSLISCWRPQAVSCMFPPFFYFFFNMNFWISFLCFLFGPTVKWTSRACTLSVSLPRCSWASQLQSPFRKDWDVPKQSVRSAPANPRGN